MGWRSILFSFLVLIVVIMLLIYYFMPYISFDFSSHEFSLKQEKSNNFTISGSEEMQFYPNMRFPDKKISYKISDSKCSLQKKNDMQRAFEIIENITILDFYPVPPDIEEEISVMCDEKYREKGGLFIAGEGGPTNITSTNSFNIITKGKILLLSKSRCEKPNVAIHELLHVLGFKHSNNRNNVMYNITNCKQEIGEDIPILINEIYSVPSFPDLYFEDVSANTVAEYFNYLNIKVDIRNQGLEDSREFDVEVYSDNKKIKTIEVEPIGMGYGRRIIVSNILISKNVKELEFFINSSFSEINKKNNRISLVIED